MRLKLMAPFRSHFCLNVGAMPLNDIDKNYIDFWTRVQKKYDEQKITSRNLCEQIAFMHSESHLKKTGSTLYERIDEDTLKCFLQVMELTPKGTDQTIHQAFKSALQKEREKASENGQDERVEMCDKFSDLCRPDPNTVSIRVYDNTISIAQMNLDLFNLSNHSLNYQTFLDILHSIGISFAHTYIVKLYNTAIFPLLDELSKRFDPQSKYIKSIKMYDDFRDILPYVADWHAHRSQNSYPFPEITVLWVTRTLIFENGDQEFVDNFVEYWLKDIGNQAKREKAIEEMKTNAKAYSLSWLNYAFREQAFAPNDKQIADQENEAISESNDAWESMLMSQYFYSALECLNNNLQHVIGRSYAPNADQELRDLNRHLKRTTATTNLLIIYYSEIQKYLKRDKKEIMSQIMDTWDFRSLIKNAQDRISLCNERINNLHKVSTERSSLATDLLLFGIGAVSFISLIITLSQYGRLLNTDATLGFRNDGPFNIFGFISRWPMDYVLFTGTLIILVLTFFYYLFRRKKLL